MKAIFSVPVVVFALCTLVSQGGEKKNGKKEDGIKVNVTYLEKAWGIKYKSHSITDEAFMGNPIKRVRLLLEFTKDVDNVKEIREAFVLTSYPPKADTKISLWFYCFDEDNVVAGKCYPLQTE